MFLVPVIVASALLSAVSASDAVFEAILNSASRAPLSVNSFAFTDAHCISEDFPDRPGYCEKIAKGIVQATEAYTSVFDFPRKINVGITVSIEEWDGDHLADCAAVNLVDAPRSNLVNVLKLDALEAISGSGRRWSGLDVGRVDMDINVKAADNIFCFAGEEMASADGKFDFVETILHELGHGLGMFSFVNLQFYREKWYLVPEILLQQVPGRRFEPRMQVTTYDEHIQSASESFVLKRDVLKLSELVAQNGVLPYTDGYGRDEDLSIWPVAALEFSEKLARHVLNEPMYFKSNSGKLYQLDTNIYNSFWSHLHKDYASGSNKTMNQDYLMSAASLPRPYTQTLGMLYGNASLPVSNLIGPGLRDILSSIGWRLR